ncbi:MAG: bifunctional 4-hydroxy-2-oxoglutarate aldolase/2-dehydro-3-deoxy-phosphogluconate aldolase [Myxococcota bacterium]
MHWSPWLEARLRSVAVLPVIVLSDASHAAPLARALYAGGVTVMEVTLRTPASLEAITRMREAVPDAVVGAGTVLSLDQARAAREAGAQFLVSPGSSPRNLEALLSTDLPFLPGAVTATEVMTLQEQGLSLLKYFPAEPMGGIAALKALSGPLPGVRFCPTGSIERGKVSEYLKQPTVMCVGGSWLTPDDALKAGDFERIRALALSSHALRLER